MFKKIKKKLNLQKRIQFEVLETLATITQYLIHDSYGPRNPYTNHLHGHFRSLKDLSAELRKEEGIYE